MLGDEFLDLVPNWYRQKAARYLTVVTDLARLVLLRQYLEEGFDRVIWIDADVIVFDPVLLKVDPELPYGYSREIWIEKRASGSLIATQKINNSACLFSNRSNSLEHLDEYIDACKSTVAGQVKLRDHTEVGTKFLTSRNRQQALPILRGFGLLSPTVQHALLESDAEILNQLVKLQDDTLCAVNLCNFLRAKRKEGVDYADETYSRVVDRLVEAGSYLRRSTP
jgi:hypothetical protein